MPKTNGKQPNKLNNKKEEKSNKKQEQNNKLVIQMPDIIMIITYSVEFCTDFIILNNYN